MAKLAIWFGIALIVLGVVGFVLTGHMHPTSLIPAWFGIALLVCGVLAVTPDARRRMVWMHIAVTIGLIGFIFPGVMALEAWVRAHGGPLADPAAVKDQSIMSVICLLFTLLCVRSFIAARRARTA